MNLRCSLEGVCPSIYSLVECTCAVVNQGPGCIKRGGGGSFQKRGVKTPEGAPAGAMVGPAGPTWRPLGPLLLRVSSQSFLSLLVMFPVADKFRVYFAFESLFSVLCEINQKKYRICKTCGNCQFKP